MTEGDFMAVLHQGPGYETACSVFADWLDETGQNERAELVRLICRLRESAVMEPTKDRVGLEARVAALLKAGIRPVTPEIVNEVSMRFALIPPGAFRMGAPLAERETEEPSPQVTLARADQKRRCFDEMEHEVKVSRPFYLGIHTVTQQQYQAVMGANPSYFSRFGAGRKSVKEVIDANLCNFPVDSVSWEDVHDFLKVLNAMAETRAKGWKYQLPSEAEWEYSCRGGGICSTPFHTGATLSSFQANFDGKYPYGSAVEGPCLGRTCRVGSYHPNALGLFDMHGNVWEWCEDWLADYNGGANINPPGPPKGLYRIVRGGAFNYPGWFCRSAYRDGYSPRDRLATVGFRVALIQSEIREEPERNLSREIEMQ